MIREAQGKTYDVVAMGTQSPHVQLSYLLPHRACQNIVGIDPGSQTSQGKSLVIGPSGRKHRCQCLIRSIQSPKYSKLPTMYLPHGAEKMWVLIALAAPITVVNQGRQFPPGALGNKDGPLNCNSGWTTLGGGCRNWSFFMPILAGAPHGAKAKTGMSLFRRYGVEEGKLMYRTWYSGVRT